MTEKKSKAVKAKPKKTVPVKSDLDKSRKKIQDQTKKPEKLNTKAERPKKRTPAPQKKQEIKQEEKKVIKETAAEKMISSKIVERKTKSSRINKILASRAKELSEQVIDERVISETIEVVEFVLAYEQYGIESSYIREVFSMKEYTQIPGTPGFVLGVVNVRGQILSVVDVKKFFGLPTGGLSDLNRVVICSYNDMEVGVLADIIKGVRIVKLEDIQSSLPTINDARAEYIKGVTEEGLVILDIEKLFSQSKLIVNDEVEA